MSFASWCCTFHLSSEKFLSAFRRAVYAALGCIFWHFFLVKVVSQKCIWTVISSHGPVVKVGIPLAIFLLCFMISSGGGLPASSAFLPLALCYLGVWSWKENPAVQQFQFPPNIPKWEKSPTYCVQGVRAHETLAAASMGCWERSVNEGGSSWLTWFVLFDALLIQNWRR